jgi:hypothetical protein
MPPAANAIWRWLLVCISSGQRIDQLLLGALALGDVAHDCRGADCNACSCRAPGVTTTDTCTGVTVAPHAHAFVAQVLAGAHAGVERLELGVGAFGIEDAHGLADHLLGWISEQALRGRIPGQDDAAERHADDGVVAPDTSEASRALAPRPACAR